MDEPRRNEPNMNVHSDLKVRSVQNELKSQSLRFNTKQKTTKPVVATKTTPSPASKISSYFPHKTTSRIAQNKTKIVRETSKNIQRFMTKIQPTSKIIEATTKSMKPKAVKREQNDAKNDEIPPQSPTQDKNDDDASHFDQQVEDNSLRIQQLERNLEELTQDFSINFTKSHNMMTYNEEKMDEMKDDLASLDKIEEEIEDIKKNLTVIQRAAKFHEKFLKLSQRVDDVERKLASDPSKKAFKSDFQKLSKKIEKIEEKMKEKNSFKVQSNKEPQFDNDSIDNDAIVENLGEKLNKIERKNEKLEKENKMIIYSGIGLTMIFLIFIIFVSCKLNGKKKTKKNHVEMTSLQNIGTTHRTVAPPFTVYDSNRNSNPFRNELCVDGTNMYDEVAMDARMKGEGLI
jgi:DNA repair exonuclease SbcCD ATPase subunit